MTALATPHTAFYQVSPLIKVKAEHIPNKDGSQKTEAQLELFELVPTHYEFVERVLKMLPRQQMREHVRNLYINEYRSTKGTTNQKAYTANTWIRTVVQDRLKKVFKQNKINLADLIAFNRQQSHWQQALEKEIKEELKRNPPPNRETDPKGFKAYQQAELNKSDFHAFKHKYGKHIAQQNRREFNRAMLPLYLISLKKLEEICQQLANTFNQFQRQYMEKHAELFAKQQRQPTESEIETIFHNLYGECGQIAESFGLDLNYWQQYKGLKRNRQLKAIYIESTLTRIVDPKHWFKRLHKIQRQMVEHIAIACGQVRKGTQQYVTNQAFNAWERQTERNLDYLKNMIVENIDDPAEQVELMDMYLHSSSNISKLRIELMTRCRGLEEDADFRQLDGLFITLTAPSAYHSILSNSGKPNQKWNGASPKQTHKYLNTVWQRTRARFKKANIQFSGLRVCEPHHDSTPHWHLLIFVQPQQKQKLIDIFKAVALAEDGDEKGAKMHRLKIDPIDKAKGTAVGYITKYISKNINGFAGKNDTSDEDHGMSLQDNAKRARAWASLWGIRQFQFFGDKFVSLWREIRRLASHLHKQEQKQKRQTAQRDQLNLDIAQPPLQKTAYPLAWQHKNKHLARAIACADVGEYGAFVDCITAGLGFLAKRKDSNLKIYYEENGTTKYGEARKKSKAFNLFLTLNQSLPD